MKTTFVLKRSFIVTAALISPSPKVILVTGGIIHRPFNPQTI